MPSLLDSILASRTRLPSANELLQERARATSLLSGSDAPVARPSIFSPRPAGHQPPNLRQMQGAAQLAGAPGPEAADPRQVQAATQGAGDQMRQFSQAAMARAIARHNNGELPASAESYIREVTNDNVDSGPGLPGRGLIGRLFTGDKVPGLSEAANKRLRNEALFSAGLAMLGSDANFGQALAAGILLARAVTTETAGELLDEKRRQARLQERYSVLSNTDLTELERWQEIRRRSAAEGDLDAAEAASDIIEDLRDRTAGEAERKPQVVGDTLVFTDGQGNAFDLDGKRISADDPRLQPAGPDPLEGAFRQNVEGPDGNVHAVLFARDGTPIRDLGVVDRPGAEEADKPDAEKAAVAAELRREVDNIRSLLGDDPDTEDVEGADRFGVTGTFGRLARILPAELEPSDLKQMRAASENILSLIVRQRSGAQATDAEVERLKSFAIPKAGDDPSTVRSKLERMEAIISDFERSGANTAVDSIMRGGERDVDAELDAIFGGGGGQ